MACFPFPDASRRIFRVILLLFRGRRAQNFVLGVVVQ